MMSETAKLKRGEALAFLVVAHAQAKFTYYFARMQSSFSSHHLAIISP
jgi:hypothetical protein